MSSRSAPAPSCSRPVRGYFRLATRCTATGGLSVLAPSAAGSSHGRPNTVHFSRPRASLALTLSCCIAVGAWPARVGAEAPPDEAPARSGSSLDMKLSVGVVRAAFWRRDLLVADLDAVSINAEARFGEFASQHLLLGFEAVGGAHIGVGDLELHDPLTLYGVPAEDGYTVLAPLGVFAELYPLTGEGVYVAASAGVGFMYMDDHPAFGEGEYFMARYSFELGYEMSKSGKQGLGWFARYNRWGAGGLSEDNPELTSHDVAAGARWSLF
jgi:hypothetical protein